MTLLPDPGPGGKLTTDLEGRDDKADDAAIHDALKLGAIGFDAVKHLVLCRIERRPPRLDLDLYPYLPRARVAATSTRSYMSLLTGADT